MAQTANAGELRVGRLIIGTYLEFHWTPVQSKTPATFSREINPAQHLFKVIAMTAALTTVVSLSHPKKGSRDGLHPRALDNAPALARIRELCAKSDSRISNLCKGNSGLRHRAEHSARDQPPRGCDQKLIPMPNGLGISKKKQST